MICDCIRGLHIMLTGRNWNSPDETSESIRAENRCCRTSLSRATRWRRSGTPGPSPCPADRDKAGQATDSTAAESQTRIPFITTA